MEKFKLGLVFDGGGGCGGYQIGVWKYLNEIGIDKYVGAISGTSVGALNAALFVNGDLKLAEDIWIDYIADKIIDLKTDIKLIKKEFYEKGICAASEKYFNLLKTTGIFSRNGLYEIIERYMNVTSISRSKIPIYATCSKLPFLKAEYFKLNGKSKDEIVKILFASSAIPIIFPTEKIGDNIYFDGGFSDNSPVEKLYDENCNHIIVVHLEAIEIIKHRKENVTIYEIYPQDNLGGFFKGMLDFSREGAINRIKQGYEEAKKILEPALMVFEENYIKRHNIKMMIERNKKLFDKRKECINKRKKLKQDIIDSINSKDK